jgi:chemotaxis response regulator CheB
MPKAAVEIGAALAVVSLDKVTQHLLNQAMKK